MSELVEALRDAMPDVDFRTGTAVTRIDKPLRVTTGSETVEADALVLTVPPPEASAILHGLSPELADRVGRIPTVSTATVSLGYRYPSPAVALDATGFVMVRKEKRRILACTWSSKKFEGRAPRDHLLVRCFLGGTGSEAVLEQDDMGLEAVAREELREIMGLHEEPVVSAVFRWPAANPIYEVGHEAKLREIEALLGKSHELYLCGSGFRGVGIPDCVREALEVVRRMVARGI